MKPVLNTTEQVSARILKAIDKGLEPIGESAKRSLYLYARRTHKLNRYEIPKRPSEFSRAIEEVYGRSALGIERRIIEIIVKDFALGSSPRLLKDAVEMAAKTSRTQ